MERYKKMGAELEDELGKILYFLIERGDVKAAKVLAADLKCNVNWIPVGGSVTSLMAASDLGYPNIIKILLTKQDLLVNHQDSIGNSALSYASMRGNTICVKLLLDDLRTDVNLINNQGHSVLWTAYYHSTIPIMKLLISHGATNVEGVAESVFDDKNKYRLCPPLPEATEVMKNWVLYLPEFTRIAKTNKYYPTEFKDWAFNFILCCLKSKSFPKDMIYLLLEYIARAWKKNLKIKNVDDFFDFKNKNKNII